MAERWQQWMPHDIDAWQGSANVQALSDLAYRAVHNLLQDMWKQDDCSLPFDAKELAKRSRVAARWSECAEEVEDYFSDRTECGNITHRVLLKKWHKAREVYEKNHNARVEAGKLGAAKRWNSSSYGKAIAEPYQSHSKPIANDSNKDIDKDSTGTKDKSKPPIAKAPAFRLPDWIGDAAWQGFEETRKRLRCPLTDRARDQTVRELEALQRLGHPPDAVLDQSTQRGWRGVFELKGGRNGSTGGNRQEGNRTSPAVQRGIDSRDRIGAAVARAINRSAGAMDGRDAGQLRQPGAPGGNVGSVACPMAGDGGNDGIGGVPGVAIEGHTR